MVEVEAIDAGSAGEALEGAAALDGWRTVALVASAILLCVICVACVVVYRVRMRRAPLEPTGWRGRQREVC